MWLAVRGSHVASSQGGHRWLAVRGHMWLTVRGSQVASSRDTSWSRRGVGGVSEKDQLSHLVKRR